MSSPPWAAEGNRDTELQEAARLDEQGEEHDRKRELGEALDCFQRSLATRERLAPDPLDVAASLNNIGNVYYQQGNLPEASEYHRRSPGEAERAG